LDLKILAFLEKIFGKRGAKTVICLVLMMLGFQNAPIKEKTGVAFSTLRRYRKVIENCDISTLFEVKAERMKSKLSPYEDVICADFDARPPKTLREAQTRVLKLTGIEISLNRLRIFLKKRALEG